MLTLGAFSAEAQHYDRGYDVASSSPFVTKGAWVLTGTARYSQHTNDNYNLLLIDNINSKGFSLAVNPKLIYMIKDNMGIGLLLSYGRSMLDLATADLSISDITMNAKDCYQIPHKDGVDMETSKLYEMVKEKKKLPKTAACSVGDFIEIFSKYLNEGYDVYYMGIG